MNTRRSGCKIPTWALEAAAEIPMVNKERKLRRFTATGLKRKKAEKEPVGRTVLRGRIAQSGSTSVTQETSRRLNRAATGTV